LESVGFWHAAAAHPDKVAVYDARGAATTYGALLRNVNRLAHLLVSKGVEPGDRVAYVLANQPEVHEVVLACAQIGVLYVPLNNHLNADGLAYILGDSGARAVVADQRFAAAVQEAATCAGIPMEGRLAVGNIEGFATLADLLDGRPSSLPSPRSSGAPLFYTSGTTGHPKGVLRRGMLGPLDRGLEFSLRPEHVHGWTAETVYLAQGPLYHIGPLSNTTTVLHLGGTVVHMDKWDAETCLRLIEEHRVTASNMVPTMFYRLLALPDQVRSRYDLSSLAQDQVVHGAAICPVHVKAAMIEWWGEVFWETYGSTEGAYTNVTSADWLKKPGTVGRPIRGVELAVLDDDGEPCPPGVVGTIYAHDTSGRHFGIEYFNAPDKTAESRRGDYFTVGDMGYLDEEGWLYLSDRRLDLINARLPSFERPRSLHFRTSLPRYSFGKLDRRRLREEYAAMTQRTPDPGICVPDVGPG
jgi:long-chain acyl-CoA synthetase